MCVIARGNARPAGGLAPSVQIAVAGATGFVGRALVARLVGDGHEVLALSRSGTRAPRRGRPGGRRGRRSGADGGARRVRGGVLPGPQPGGRRLPGPRPAPGRVVRPCGARSRSRADRLPRGPRAGPDVGAPGQPPGGGYGARRRGRGGGGAARRGDSRRRQHLVRDAALPHRAAAVHGVPALGAHRDPARRARRHGRLPRAAPSVSPPACTRSAARRSPPTAT